MADDNRSRMLIPGEEAGPQAVLETRGEALTILLSGTWTGEHASRLEGLVGQWLPACQGMRAVGIDLSKLTRLDTVGAWLIERFRFDLGSEGVKLQVHGASSLQEQLLREVGQSRLTPVQPAARSGVISVLADIGEGVAGAGRDTVKGVSFLGEIMVALGRALVSPARFRQAALTNQIEQIAFRGAPIIILISFLVGCIVTQQSIFQLQRFGATIFVVNLAGILVLRELAVLLAAIMVAGRSGSAFTAEIGSMKMREEIDALRVMGLDPVEVLIVPRILALLIGLPILTFIAMMAALIGSALVSWGYGGIGLDTFIARLQTVITYQHFTVGLIKAPFMALVIGLIASIEGLEVKGSAESLGRQVTASVVKSIFVVIVVDGLFAMFFAAIRY
jgi:phospholipid/cholesterol/gamma-HCH transport system permease protein